MKKLFLISLLLLLTGEAWGAVSISPTDYLTNQQIICETAGNDGLVGIQNSSGLSLTTKSGTTFTTSVKTATSTIDAEFDTINTLFATSTAGLMFVQVYDFAGTASNRRYLLMTVDSGVSYGDNDSAYDDGDYLIRLGQAQATTLSGDEALGQTELSVTSNAWFAANDGIGITLSGGTVQWTTVAATGAGTVTVNDALTGAASSGAVVYKHIAKVGILSLRSICEIDTNTYLVGEYSIADARTAGSINDQVRLLRITLDIGTAAPVIEEVLHWNTDGADNNIRHIHFVNYNSSTGDVYVGTGDLDACSMILRIDADDLDSIITNNATLSNHDCSWYDKDAGNVTYAADGLDAGDSYGDQTFRAIDILFAGSYGYTFSDTYTSNTDDTGIWKHALSLAGTPTRVNNGISTYGAEVDDNNHVGWIGRKLDNGVLVFVESIDGDPTDQQLRVYTSNDSGATWDDVALIGSSTSVHPSRLTGIAEYNNSLYIGGTCLAARAGEYDGGIECSVGSTFTDDYPEIIHPVCWVSTTGNDTTGDGYRPTTALATPRQAFRSSKITFGTRVIVAAGDYSQANCDIDWSINADPSTGTVVLTGAGKTSTVIHTADADNRTYVYYVASADGAIRFEDVDVYAAEGADGTGENTCYVFQCLTGSTLEFIDCKIGDKDFNSEAVPTVGMTANLGTLTAKRTIFEKYPGESNCIQNLGSTANLESCLLDGGSVGYNEDDNGGTQPTTTIQQCTFINYSSLGWSNSAGVTAVPTIKNCIFATDATAALSDVAAIDETGTTSIDFNCYNDVVTSIAAPGTSSLLATDPLLHLTGTHQYKLKAGSPCHKAGTDLNITLDLRNRTIPENKEPMGCYYGIKRMLKIGNIYLGYRP